MIIKEVFSHKNGFENLDAKIWKDITTIFSNCPLKFKPNNSRKIKRYIANKFGEIGWADRVKIHPNSNLTINYLNNRICLNLQIGNVARTYADILKICYLYNEAIITAGIIIVPSKNESSLLGTNYANFERLKKEILLFEKIVNSPIIIVALSNE